MENSVDPIHTEWLHGHLYEFQKKPALKTALAAITTPRSPSTNSPAA